MTSRPLEGKLGLGRDSRGPWHIAGALSHAGTWIPLGGGEKRAGQGPGKCFVPTAKVPFLRGSLPLVVAPSAGGPVTQTRTGHSRLLCLRCPYPLTHSRPLPSVAHFSCYHLWTLFPTSTDPALFLRCRALLHQPVSREGKQSGT